MRVRWIRLCLLFSLGMSLTNCGPNSGSGNPLFVTPAAVQGERIEIEFWHAMDGNLGLVLNDLVTRYNRSQDEIVVKPVFIGTYDELYNTLIGSLNTGLKPNVTQFYDIGTQTIIDSRAFVPAYEMMAAEGYDPNVFLPAVRAYYSDENGNLLAMPFNSSTPLVIYNADMFEAAGLDPPEQAWTFSEFRATCDRLLEAEVAPFCVTYEAGLYQAELVGWLFEQLLANSGALYFDGNNGRTDRASAVLFNQRMGVDVLTFQTDLVKEGYAPRLSEIGVGAPFETGQVAMVFSTSSLLTEFLIESNFEVGTAYIPHSNRGQRNGVVIGGAATWLIDSGDEATNAAAWDFMKFLASPQVQVTWHLGTGYLYLRIDQDDQPELIDFWETHPNFLTAFEQLATTETTLPGGGPNYAVLGGRAGPFPDIRFLVVEAAQRVIDGEISSIEALNGAATEANQLLMNYNAFYQ